MNNPDVIDWRITSKCNRKCRYCYGPEMPELNAIDKHRLIDIIASNNVRILGITGGEPLLVDGIINIINHAVELGMKVCLSTNCDYMPAFNTTLLKKLTVLGLPIDGPDSSSHDMLRGDGSFNNIMSTLQYYYYNSNVHFRIGTVITRYNYDILSEIEQALYSYQDKIVYWKLYTMILYRGRIRQVERLASDIYIDSNIEILNNLGQYMNPSKIVFDDSNNRSCSYLHINPNGDVSIPIKTDTYTYDHCLGNMLKDTWESILVSWEKHIDMNKYTNYYRCAMRCLIR